MQKILILEDNKKLAENLYSIIKKVEIQTDVFLAHDIISTKKILDENTIDIFILDIELKDENGLEFAKEIRKIPKYENSWIIFATAHDKYVLDAVQNTNCYSYFMKPYNQEQILSTLNKITNKRIVQKKPEDFLSIMSYGSVIKISYEDIVHIEVIGRDCFVHCIQNTYKIKRKSLNEIKHNISCSKLIQCHRSYIINIDFVTKFDKKHRGSNIHLKMIDNAIPVGTTYVDQVSEFLG